MRKMRMDAMSIETAYLAFRYCTYVVILIALLFWMKKGMYFGFVLAFLMAATTAYFYFQFRNTKIYHLYHSTNKDLFEDLLSAYQSQNKHILTSGRTEKGFFILEDNQGIRFGYYLPFGRKGTKQLFRIRSYVEELECLTDKYDADYPVLIMDDKAELKILLFHRLHPEHQFELWKRRSVCQYAISKGSQVIRSNKGT